MITVVLLCHALFVVSITLIVRGYKGFTLKSMLVQVRRHSLINDFQIFVEVEDITLVNYVIAISYVFTVIIKNVLINYAALFYVISIYGLAIISRKFRESCRKNKELKNILMEYRIICRVTRCHDKYYGWGLLWFMLSGLFCSTFFVQSGNLAFSSTNYGATILELWYILTYVIIVALGILFTTTVISEI